MKQLLEQAAHRATAYLDQLPTRRVAPTGEAIAALAGLAIPLPEEPQPAEATLRLLDELGSPATTATASGRYFGFVTGGSLPVTLASNWLATAWDQNSAHFGPAPATATLEQVALGWLLEVLQLPAGSAAAFATGATMANFSALAAARHAVLARAGWDVEADGLIGAPPVTVVLSEEVHPTVLKGLGLLGFGRKRVLRMPVDGQGRVLPDALPRLDGPAIVCLQAGNVNTGAFDPVAELIAAAHAQGAWVHVDGAFGLWARASDSLRTLTAGTEHADSWATDAHKWLNVPYDSGIAFVREGAALRAAMAVTADYLPQEGPQRNPSDYTPELSRRARGVDVWAALHTLGRRGVAALVEQCCAHARRFARELREAGAEILNDVVLNQVLVRFGDADATRRVVAAIQAEGTCWAGITVWQGHTAMRISVSSWATTDEDVTRSLEAMRRVMREVRG
ncbi:pyridoxal phosphate-dependent decarboxylase family protein [Azohydromonas caseinilytica]|uniref:pyridoxal phosphate-dependent decarboxylase family protein n=1 Tax=Azohydromonas caseinilytica TaxID=2728836 RepID=UPI002873A4A0|nr:aminotransferase class V-fold PLP-dependent enzyme [Azohydromonas caseinilytica]